MLRQADQIRGSGNISMFLHFHLAYESTISKGQQGAEVKWTKEWQLVGGEIWKLINRNDPQAAPARAAPGCTVGISNFKQQIAI